MSAPQVKRTDPGIGQDLTRREREILELVAQGLSNQAIADRLVVSLHTVRNHVQSVLTKLHAHSKAEAARVARHEGLVARGPCSQELGVVDERGYL